MKAKKSKILNGKTIAAAFLTIGLCIVINLLLSLLGDSWEKLFSAVGSIGSVTIGVGMFYLGWQQQKHFEQQISDSQKDSIFRHYRDLKDLLRKIFKDTHNKDTEVLKMMWDLEDMVKLWGSQELSNYISEIREKTVQVYSEAHLRLSKGGDESVEEGEERKEGRDRLWKGWEEYRSYISNLKPESLYSKYLKIPNQNL